MWLAAGWQRSVGQPLRTGAAFGDEGLPGLATAFELALEPLAVATLSAMLLAWPTSAPHLSCHLGGCLCTCARKPPGCTPPPHPYPNLPAHSHLLHHTHPSSHAQWCLSIQGFTGWIPYVFVRRDWASGRESRTTHPMGDLAAPGQQRRLARLLTAATSVLNMVSQRDSLLFGGSPPGPTRRECDCVYVCVRACASIFKVFFWLGAGLLLSH